MEEMRTLEGLEEGLGVSFHDQQLLRDATTHDSAVQERLAKDSYERLEFLGDAILGQAIAELTYHEFPSLAEGKLSKIRAAVVNNENLATVARNELHLGAYLLLGKGEKDHGGSEKTSILAGSFEAVLGAIHVDQGAETATTSNCGSPRPEGPALGDRAEAVFTVESPRGVCQEFCASGSA